MIEMRLRVAPTSGFKHAAESTATIKRTGSKLNASSGSVLERGSGTGNQLARSTEDRREQSVTSGRATRGRAVEGAPLDREAAATSGTGPTSTPTGTGPGGNVRTPGTAVSGGPTEGGR
jgi:hypothetical protein